MRQKKVIFISLVQIDSLDERGIYQDLLRQFALNGHEVTIVCPVERRIGLRTRLIKEGRVSILQVRSLNIQKSPIWEKGIALLSVNFVLQKAVKKHLSTSRFDIILYATPPITITRLIRWLKRKSDAKTYLLLKDIFPQNAVDMGMLSNTSTLHSYFKRKEKQLYELSDRIGCMSPGNVEYIIRHHPELTSRVEENPNSIDLTKVRQVNTNKSLVFEKWGIPADSVVYLYGGNLGKPQGTSFLVSVIEGAVSLSNAYFLIVGDGTDYPVLRQWFEDNRPHNAKLVQRLPKADFDELAACCDVGLILLRKEFTIPNFPSRLLTYLENKLPVLAMTDTASDIGPIIEREGFGKWCLYGDKEEVLNQISFLSSNDQLRSRMGEKGFDYMKENYDVKISYDKIIDFALSKFN